MRRGFYLQIVTGSIGEAGALARRLAEDPAPGLTDLIPGYINLYLEYDPRKTSERRIRSWIAVMGTLSTSSIGREVGIPVIYNGADLPYVSRTTGLTVSEIIRLHAERPYRVHALGFLPGFPFMRGLNQAIHVPRRSSPRKQVPANSVAIAGDQTGIYTLSSPGGWRLIGRALARIYDPHQSEPFLVNAGDTIRFVPTEGECPGEPEPLELLPKQPRFPVLRTIEAGLLDLIVDQGRLLAGRFGLACGGPLDALSARSANALVGNGPNAPLLEINLTGPVFQVLRPVVAAFAGFGLQPLLNKTPLSSWTSFALQTGDYLRFSSAPPGARGYLALAGGIESLKFMGSASIDLRARIGRPLWAGDTLGVYRYRAARAGYSIRPPFLSTKEVRLRILPGPQADRDVLEAITAGSFTVSAADRTALRLTGPKIPGGEILSEAVPLGALQVPPSGEPIILLADRGTLGGYRKPAVLHPSDLARAAQLTMGQQIRFRLV